MFIASILAGLFFVGGPVGAIFGSDAGAYVGLIAGFGIYLLCGCPHCGKAAPPLAPVCPHCGRVKRGGEAG